MAMLRLQIRKAPQATKPNADARRKLRGTDGGGMALGKPGGRPSQPPRLFPGAAPGDVIGIVVKMTPNAEDFSGTYFGTYRSESHPTLALSKASRLF
ncbi:MAG: hypothetical protein HKL80_03335 [Acidimicrobiales bacterium]|nr:hypothetical protein [Acidimicrobiales bacterium]